MYFIFILFLFIVIFILFFNLFFNFIFYSNLFILFICSTAGHWSRNGCVMTDRYELRGENYVTCSCSHLSTYAVLMDMTSVEVIKDSFLFVCNPQGSGLAFFSTIILEPSQKWTSIIPQNFKPKYFVSLFILTLSFIVISIIKTPLKCSR